MKTKSVKLKEEKENLPKNPPALERARKLFDQLTESYAKNKDFTFVNFRDLKNAYEEAVSESAPYSKEPSTYISKEMRLKFALEQCANQLGNSDSNSIMSFIEDLNEESMSDNEVYCYTIITTLLNIISGKLK